MVSDSFLYYYYVITDEKFLFLRDMITFGYNSRFKGPLRALAALAIGIVMVVSKTNALNLAVQIIAAFLIASGIVTLAVGYKNRANGTFSLMAVNTVVDILLALVLFTFPGFFANLLVVILGFSFRPLWKHKYKYRNIIISPTGKPEDTAGNL